jgi:Rrf2 family nitric oxide-sensitive transcriptional repressor
VKLNLATDYALRALMYLSWRRDKKVTAEEVSDFYGISREHVVKIMRELARIGLIQARRGRGGGNVLARNPESITVAEVVVHFERSSKLLDCFAREDFCSIQPDCGLRQVFAVAVDRFIESLRSVTVADIAGSGPPRVVPLGATGSVGSGSVGSTESVSEIGPTLAAEPNDP